MDVFVTTILKNDMIPGFNDLLARCTQEETRIMENDKSNNANEPSAFFTHAKRKNDVVPRNL